MRTLTSIAILGACHHGAAPPLPSGPATDLAKQAFTAGSGSGSVGTGALDQLDADERPILARVVFDARHVVASEEFHRTLAEQDELDVSAGGGWLTGEAVDHVYRGESTFVVLPVCYQATSPERALFVRHETATTGIEGRCGSTMGTFAVTRLHPVVLDRADQIPEGRACAINTVAHEWTHSIVGREGRQVFTDGNYQAYDEPFVSYAVGAVAQCVYLQRWRPELDISACVHAAGTHQFGHCTCEPGWLDQFMAGDTTCK